MSLFKKDKKEENIPMPKTQTMSFDLSKQVAEAKANEQKPNEEISPYLAWLKTQVEEYHNNYNGIFQFGNPQDHNLNLLFALWLELKKNNELLEKLIELAKQ